MVEKRLLSEMVVQVQDDHPEKGPKTAHFHLKMDHGMAPRHGNTHLQSLDTPIAMEEEWPSLEMHT